MKPNQPSPPSAASRHELIRQIRKEVLPKYFSTGPVHRIRYFVKGYGQQKLIVTTGDCTYLLRVFPIEPDNSTIVAMLGAQRRLAVESLSVFPMVAVDGSSFISTDKYGFVLTPYVQGRQMLLANISIRSARELAALISRAHMALQDLSPHRPSLKQMALPEVPNRTIRRFEQYMRLSIDKEKREMLRHRCVELEYIDLDLRGRVQMLPYQVLHGDFFAANVIREASTGRLILIDLARTCTFYRAYEVFRGIFRSILYASPLARMKLFAAYLNEYGRLTPLSALERELSLHLYYWVLLSDDYGLMPESQSFTGNCTVDHQFCRYRHELLLWIKGHFSDLQSIIQSSRSGGLPS